ncbi:hypothetical protein HanXRQr2_Chr02g0045911 [Helianthus annuus]|uniref:Transmembrane protein n=1 Tax=Helianthus annuus TaxID=4232 RepID=A0A251RS83_HELAN|nr:hypothetical protein HanXRQr2_Chr02g0045911 [Helianthus annuus]KAJ0950215.1 hypothetical protein HanPSC8_Chr02g0045561 [Helianthus annuus]
MIGRTNTFSKSLRTMMRLMKLHLLVVLVLVICLHGGKHASINIKPSGVPPPKVCSPRCVATSFVHNYCCYGVQEIE